MSQYIARMCYVSELWMSPAPRIYLPISTIPGGGGGVLLAVIEKLPLVLTHKTKDHPAVEDPYITSNAACHHPIKHIEES